MKNQIQAILFTVFRQRLIKNKTVIIIAHRMRTIAGADKIVVIKDGKSDEQGAPKELKNRNGFYTRMLSLQRKE